MTAQAPFTVQAMIAQVRAQAAEAGDQAKVELCDKAMAGQTNAKSQVLQLWRQQANVES